MTGVKLEKIKRDQEEEYLILLKDMLKEIINICVIMTRINSQHLLLTWIKITYMVCE